MKNNNLSFFSIALQKITIKRLYNALKVLFAYYLSLLFRKPINFGIPIVFSIEPSSACNLHCPECLSGTNQISRKNSHFDIELFKKIIHQIHKKTWIINLYFQGEPLLHPNIIEMIRISNKAGLMTVISTNGNLITEKLANDLIDSGLDILIISLDGWNQETYEIYRKGGNFNKLVAGMKFIKEARFEKRTQTSSIIAQCLYTSTSEKHLSKIKQIAHQYGFSLVLKSIQIYGEIDSNKLLPTSNSRYVLNEDKLFSKAKNKNRCRRLWTHSVITSDGLIVACCNDKFPEHIFGDILVETLENILKSNKRTDFLQNVLINKSSISICRNCEI